MALNWGIVGCGLISHDFAQAMRKCIHPNKLVAIASSDKQKAENLAEKIRKYGHEDFMVYGSYAEIFSDSNVDIVYIGVVNHKHHDVAMQAMDAGKHVLCEKPIGVNLGEAQEMYRKANEKGRFFMEATWSRFFPAYKKLRQVIESKELGEVVGCGATFCTKALSKNRFWPEAGASPLNDIGSYCVQFANWANHGQKPTKITADCGKNSSGCDLWDAIILQFPENRKAVLFLSTVDAAHNTGFVSFERGYVELGDNFWCPEKLTIQREDDEKPEEHEYPLDDDGKYNFAKSSGLRYETDHVFECLREGELESSVHGREESFKTIEVLDKIREQLGITYLNEAEK